MKIVFFAIQLSSLVNVGLLVVDAAFAETAANIAISLLLCFLVAVNWWQWARLGSMWRRDIGGEEAALISISLPSMRRKKVKQEIFGTFLVAFFIAMVGLCFVSLSFPGDLTLLAWFSSIMVNAVGVAILAEYMRRVFVEEDLFDICLNDKLYLIHVSFDMMDTAE